MAQLKQCSFGWSFIFLRFIMFGCAGSSLPHAAFLTCGEWGLLSVAVRRLLTAVASRCGARTVPMGFSSCSVCALVHRLSGFVTRA